MAKLIFKDLSFKLNGIAFKIDNELGFGHDEKTYSQLLHYLKGQNLKLGLIIRFTVNGVRVKRVPNFHS